MFSVVQFRSIGAKEFNFKPINKMKYTKEQKEKLKKFSADRFVVGTKNKIASGDYYIYESKMNYETIPTPRKIY